MKYDFISLCRTLLETRKESNVSHVLTPSLFQATDVSCNTKLIPHRFLKPQKFTL